MRGLLYSVLLSAAVLSACESVRTVYDENGQEVKDDAPGGEKDLMSHFEAQFDASFSEKRSKDGVPQATSNKVSRFQKDIDAARRDDKQFSTGAFGGTGRSNLRTITFGGTDKEFSASRKVYGDTGISSVSRDLRPDFMNDSHGISHNDSFMDHSSRSASEGLQASGTGLIFATSEGDVQTSQQSGYFESRRNKSPQPKIMNYRDYYRKTIQETRTMLGRDKEADGD